MWAASGMGNGEDEVLLLAVGVSESTGKKGGDERRRLSRDSRGLASGLVEIRIIQECKEQRESRGRTEGQVAREGEDGVRCPLPSVE